ncbi:hypothetical protein ScPMuIL_005139 [Solemya velum]
MAISDDFVYCCLLLVSIAFGGVVKQTNGPRKRQLLCGGVGILLIVTTSQYHLLHSLTTAIVSYIVIVTTGPRYCHVFNFAWCFTYLTFFRTTHYFGLPVSPPLANAVQLLLTLRMIGISFEIHDTHHMPEKIAGMVKGSLELRKKYKGVTLSFFDFMMYAYCYAGLLTGPYYKYRTYYDFIHQSDPEKIPTYELMLQKIKVVPVIAGLFLFFSYFFNIEYPTTAKFFEEPFWFRLFYMVPMFIIFRCRMYTAWVLAEAMCITCALGAYPKTSKPRCGQGPTDLQALEDSEKSGGPVDYDFETVHNLDIYGCDLAPTTKEGLKSWNMTVQYWLAAFTYSRVPGALKPYRVAITMAVSAVWHGIHPGYYLSFLTVPLILMAEEGMIKLLRHKNPDLFDWAFKKRSTIARMLNNGRGMELPKLLIELEE